MSREQRLVVIDHSTDTADVLRAVFQPRGVAVERQRFSAVGKSRASSDVFVLDEDSLDELSVTRENGWGSQPRVLIGSATVEDRAARSPADADAYLTKPFQYADLIQAVEYLLADRDGRRAA